MTSFHQKLWKSFFASFHFSKKLAGVRLPHVLQRHSKVEWLCMWTVCSCYLTKNSVSLLHSVTTTFGTSRGLSRWCSTLALEWKKGKKWEIKLFAWEKYFLHFTLPSWTRVMYLNVHVQGWENVSHNSLIYLMAFFTSSWRMYSSGAGM